MPHHFTDLRALTAPYSHIYLSPHLDDGALSCGGAIARAVADQAPVLIVNICTGAPGPHLVFSQFAQDHHLRWGLRPQEAMSHRLAEDMAALETLGADSYQLDALDAIYRMPDAYGDNEGLFGRVADDDPLPRELARRVAEVAERFPQAIIYAPLGVGDHVDHQIACAVGLSLAGAGASVAFYEDIPYVLQAGALEARLEALGGADQFTPITSNIDGTLARKISSIESYVSQLGSLFGDVASMARQISDYAEGLRPEAGTYGERIWLRR